MAFDELRVVVAGGGGVVARLPGLLAVAQGPDAGVQHLIALCRASAGATPGRGLARRLAAWLGTDDAPGDELRFGTVSATERGLAVFLRGAVELRVPAAGTAMSGADAAAWTDRLIDAPEAPLTLALPGAAPPGDLGGSVFDLREGVVPGAAVVAWSPVGSPVPAAGADTGEQQAQAPPPPDDATQVITRPPQAAEDRPAGEQPRAEGYRCGQGHLNDPRADACALCGARMSESQGVLEVGVRPALGVLVFDDGATHALDTGYLLGREPGADPRVRSGALRPITLDDPSGAMSRVHAEIRLENWDVLLADSGSSNGTYAAGPGASAWTGVAGRPVRLLPGARVRMGQRTFTFRTASGAR